MTDPNRGLRCIGTLALLLAGASGWALTQTPTGSGPFAAAVVALVTFAVPACVAGYRLAFDAWRDRCRQRRLARRPIRLRLLMHI
ncbi:protein of unknown function (plasmid) [Rhodovastum atsumiense]|uniref:hypothetical protein n=1 Tax=Rhodovastum atsumiense TaxID=504468 RepID=UPI002024CD1B|nr:hypothetical protein [Rhodovastum atsumiense]CAH2605468.1 protein of unknown function [Rhodovastum atsumiense]